MSKYRKRPIMFEAHQFLDGVPVEGMHKADDGRTKFYWCVTSEGHPTVSDGDFIVKDAEGEFSLWNPDVFKQIFEEDKGQG